jgi:hypothetical protein
LPPPPPLRTVQAPFDAYGSSLDERPARDAVPFRYASRSPTKRPASREDLPSGAALPHTCQLDMPHRRTRCGFGLLHGTVPARAHYGFFAGSSERGRSGNTSTLRAGSRLTLSPRGGRTSKPDGCRHLLVPCVGWPGSRVTQDPREVCPFSGGVCCPQAQPLSARLLDGVRLFPRPLPAAASVSLTGHLPRGTATGLPRSVGIPEWVRSRLSAGGASSAWGEFGAPHLDPVPFGPSLSASLAC